MLERTNCKPKQNIVCAVIYQIHKIWLANRLRSKVFKAIIFVLRAKYYFILFDNSTQVNSRQRYPN
jgi:hypothetical protein